VDIRIARPDGTTCAPNETGELLARGPNVMAGYWRRPDLAPVDADGWLSTGDAARIDDEGFVWLVDRLVDGFETSGGGRVYPGDIERVLAAHPGVGDVGVVAIGGRAHAFVVLADGAVANEAELLAHCRTHLAPHAIPASIQLIDRIPRTTVGKMMRQELAARVGS
ncbi:MAG TPA: long-chain fatty acid--CoA ligase, partial [Kofleriaceae bacterium]|nr:long-chain fatty acid--CoA ligase [Kofleriaceae bacterium]